MVYIREAHPSDAWQSASNVEEGIVFAAPRSDDERHALAQTCSVQLAPGFPAVVDTLDDATEAAYCAWPERLVLVGRDGKLRWLSGPGPFGFDPAALEVELENLSLESACR